MSDVLAATLDRPKPAQPASGERAIDLVHLARMTLGERSLEREVLQLFDRQSTLLMGRMQAAPAAAVVTLVHTLKGSARAIGAGCVARAAERVELLGTADDADLRRALAALGAAVDEARAFIAEVLRAH
jgi:HPt (histidine-containing phosphotransfer) domain-containing protein